LKIRICDSADSSKNIKKLTITLQSEISSEEPVISLDKLILKAPTWSDSELKNYNEAKNHINKSRIA